MAENCCLFTRGELFIRGAPKPSELCPDVECIPDSAYKGLGNISSALIEVQASVFGRENPFNLAYSSARQEILGASVSLTLNCINIKHLYQYLFSAKEVPSDITLNHIERFQTSTVEVGDFFPFEKQKADLNSVIVKWAEPLPGTDFIIANAEDYVLSQSGIQYQNADGYFPDWNLVVEYNYNESTNFASFEYNSESQEYKSLFFRGVNYADGGSNVFNVFIPKVLFPPINQLELISQSEFTTIQLSGVIEKSDDTWFKIVKQEE